MVGVALATLMLASLMGTRGAWAHDDDHHRLQGQKLKMTDPAGAPTKRKFLFKTKKQTAINDTLLDTDPTTTGANLIVRGTGVGDGTSGVIYLPQEGWKALPGKGFQYKGDAKAPGLGGVQKVQLKTSPKGGQLLIKAKGANWPYEITGSQTAIEIMVAIDTDVYCAAYDEIDEMTTNSSGEVTSNELANLPPDCAAVCGNGIQELGESCDDGNAVNTDTCSNQCGFCTTSQDDFTSTFEGIQALIFDNPVLDCSNVQCHGGANPAGGLNLTAGNSYLSLLGPNGQGAPATTTSALRVFPGDDDASLLYSNIALKTLGAGTIPGSQPMPTNTATVTPELLDALRLWIRGGAPETGVVQGTAELLGACLPEPGPLKIPQPDAPAVGTGVQVAMPGWDLPAQSEDEICVPSFYDFSSVVPPAYRIPCPGVFPGTNDPPNGTGECFTYNFTGLFQDPQSHHSIVHIYAGVADETDPGWGTWTCYLGANDGQACDPTDANACPGGVCGGTTKSAVACIGFGPSDYSQNGNTAPTWQGSQEPIAAFAYPTGVYSLLPLRGVIAWNSHAFNLTNTDMNMQGWINIDFTDDLQYTARGLFNDDQIFTQNVPPYQSREYCYTHTFSQNTNLFQLSSHMHKHGKRWRYFNPPQTPCTNTASCSAGNPANMFYESYDYSDPLTIYYDPPRVFSGTQAERTIKFCALYDNGEGDPNEVKTRSGSPCPPPPFPCPSLGGPCTLETAFCKDGTNPGASCGCPGSGAVCDNGTCVGGSAAGTTCGDGACTGGGTCDACTLRGGVTTEDEMFIAIGTYFLP